MSLLLFGEYSLRCLLECQCSMYNRDMEIPSDIKPYLGAIRRMSPSSHKGQNGKVLLIGGSELFHSASRWCLDVVSSMVDMVFYSSVPENNTLIQEAKREFWDGVVVPRGELESYLNEAEVVVIGPGMTRDEQQTVGKATKEMTFAKPSAEAWNHDTYAVANYLLSTYPKKKWVIDAGALQMIEPALLNKHCIITPHPGELDRVVTHAGNEQALLKTGVSILLKGQEDKVYTVDKQLLVGGGNPGMTKGGTGDALAGLVAGLSVFTDDPFAAAVVASFVNKQAGDRLYTEVGPFFKTNALVEEIPRVLKELLY